MNSDMELNATDVTDTKKKRRIRRLREPNPMEDVPDQDSAQNHSFVFGLLIRAILGQ